MIILQETKKISLKTKRVKYINAHTKNISKSLNINTKKIFIHLFHFGEFARIYQSFFENERMHQFKYYWFSRSI